MMDSCVILAVSPLLYSTAIDKGFLRAVHTAYEANVSSFKHGDARFTFSINYEDPLVAEGFYAFDGVHARYELLLTADQITAHRIKTGPNEWSFPPLPAERMLTNGDVTLLDHLGLTEEAVPKIRHQAQINAGSNRFFSFVIFPLKIGAPRASGLEYSYDVGQDLAATEKGGSWICHNIDESSNLDGHPCCYFELRRGSSVREYWLDMERGCVPLKILDSDDPPSSTMQLDFEDIRLVDSIGWLPFHTLITLTWANGSMVREVVVQEAQFASAPPRSTFQLEFPEPIPMINAATSVRYAPQKVWSLLDLPREGTQGAERIQIYSATSPAPAMPGPERRSGWTPYVYVLVGVLLLLALLLTWRWRVTSSRPN
jgi:hypothetical protein